MKKAIAYVIFALATVSTLQAHAKNVTANILNVAPVYSNREQQTQVCDLDRYEAPQEAAPVNAGTVIGGIAGALLGAQVGNGNGRIAMAALGAVTGAVSGDRISQRPSQPQKVCRWVQRIDQQISGYRVVYAYEGDTYETVLPYDPSRGGSVSTVNVKLTLSLR